MLEPEYIATTHGYRCHYTPTIMDGPTFRWGDDRFEISAGRHGVTFSGYSSQLKLADINQLIRVIGVASHISSVLAKNDRDVASVKKSIQEHAMIIMHSEKRTAAVRSGPRPILIDRGEESEGDATSVEDRPETGIQAGLSEMLTAAQAIARFVRETADDVEPTNSPEEVAEWADDLCADIATLAAE
jgi:hypothetical protein